MGYDTWSLSSHSLSYTPSVNIFQWIKLKADRLKSNSGLLREVHTIFCVVHSYLALYLSNMYWVQDFGVIVDAEGPDHLPSVLLIFLLVFDLTSTTMRTVSILHQTMLLVCFMLCRRPPKSFTYITSDVGVGPSCEDWNRISFHLKFLCFRLFPFVLVARLGTWNVINLIG